MKCVVRIKKHITDFHKKTSEESYRRFYKKYTEEPKLSVMKMSENVATLPISSEDEKEVSMSSDRILNHAKRLTEEDKKRFKISTSRYMYCYRNVSDLCKDFENWLSKANGKNPRVP